MVETITAAAIMQGDAVCFVPRPGRHHDVIRALVESGSSTPIVGTQGFVTSAGRFVEREEARKIAEAADQIIDSRVDDAGVPCKFEHHMLFSEDVW